MSGLWSSLNFRLLCLIAILALAAIVVENAISASVFNKRYEGDLARELSMVEKVHKPALEGFIRQNDNERVKAWLDTLISGGLFSYAEIRRHGQVSAFSGEPTPEIASSCRLPLTTASLTGDGETGELRLVPSQYGFSRRLEDELFLDLLNIILLILSISGVVYFYISRKVTRPLAILSRELNAASSKYAEKSGHYIAKSKDEIGSVIGIVDELKRGLASSQEELRAANQRLRESEKRYRVLAENSSDVIWSMDLSGKFTYVSPSILRLRGYSPEEALAQRLDEAFCHDSVSRMRQQLRLVAEAARENKQMTLPLVELEQPHRDGSSVWTEAAAQIMYDDARHPTGIIGVSRDISGRKLAEQAMRQSEQKLSIFFQTAPDALAIYRLSDDTYVEINRGFERVTGYSREEVLGRKAREIGVWDSYEERQRIIAELLEHGEVMHRDFAFKRKDGSHGQGLFSGSLIELDGDRHVVIVVADITERKQAEQKLGESQKFIEDILNAIPARVFWKGLDRRYLGCNLLFARDLGLEKVADVVGKDDFSLPWNQHAEKYRSVDEEVMATRKPMLLMPEVQETEQGRRHLLANKLPLIGPDGAVTGVLGTYLDITDYVMLREQMHQSQKLEAIGQLASGVAHDFNNLLTSILGCAELLRSALRDNEKGSRYIGTIMTSAEQAADLSRRLLSFARKGESKHIPLDLHDIIRDAELILGRSIGPNVEILTQLKAPSSIMHGDTSSLQNAIVNLCLNSRDAMPEGGIITISTKGIVLDANSCHGNLAGITPGEYIELRVEDTGCGIPVETRDRIFEPFFTTKPQGKGTGLGLASVYGAVKEHNGAVQVYSEIGVGTAFVLYLPITPNAALPMREEEVVKGSGTILVVEDDPAVNATACESLKAIGYNTISAKDGHEAMDIARTSGSTLNLVLLDMVMPVMGGRETFYALRAILPGIPVLFATGFAESKTLDDLLKNDCVACIPKPYRLANLSQEVNTLLQKSASRPAMAQAEVENPRETMPYSAIVVEDDESLRRLMAALLLRRGHKVMECRSMEAARETMRCFLCDILITDWNLPDGEGLELCRQAKESDHACYAIVVTGRNQLVDLTKALAGGADDYLVKPFSVDHFSVRVGVAEQNVENARLRREAERALRDANENLESTVQERTAALRDEMQARIKAEEMSHRRELELARSERLVSLGTLVAGIGHEINNPIQFIMLNTPLVRDALADAIGIINERITECASLTLAGMPYDSAKRELPVLTADIIHGAERIRRIIDELRNYARPIDQRSFTMVNMSQVARSAVTLMRSSIDKMTHNFSVEVDEGLPQIMANPTRLEQLLVNLVQNACQSLETPEKAVRLFLRRDLLREGILIIVDDDGQGIPKDILSRIADPFFTTRQSSGGTGLGLAISQRIVSDHHGEMRFESVPGKGTTVTVFLPLKGGVSLKPASEGKDIATGGDIAPGGTEAKS